ncbi:hypothetical protein [Calidithermus chliarophilus]|uniref:hypothetical protein n=1 Tax=Calidithermus chliarophilus TaxID=52023 RepID=UPI00041C0099|nr:hypothetical protein [Calidithermus chliarophilus]
MLRRVGKLGWAALLGLALAAPAPAGLTHAQPGSPVVVRLEVRVPKEYVLHVRTSIGLAHPFQAGLKLTRSPQGTPWPPDPEHYVENALPLEWKLNVPKTAKPGDYPLRFEGDVYFCNTDKGLCLKQKAAAQGVLRVGKQGQDRVGVLEVRPETPFGF